VESASASEIYFLEADADDTLDPDMDEVHNKILEILGTTRTDVGVGRLERGMPHAHPEYPNMMAHSVKVSGVPDDLFTRTEIDPADMRESPPTRPDYPLWQSYEFQINYSPRPFAVITDEILDLEIGEAEWVDEDNVHHPFTFWPEWLRFTNTEYLPRNDILKCKWGEMKFVAPGEVPVDGTPYVATHYLPLPNDTLRMTWYQVPYRYITSSNSYIRRFRNRINQFDWYGYPPGSLLYAGYTVKFYSPPLAGIDPNWGGAGVTSTAKLCDVTFEFILTRRTIAVAVPAPANGNHIALGHNLLPRIQNRKYYYVVSSPGLVPSYLSYPAESLFLDPDAGLGI
jgi:hypothetical protein